jgi:hypothetical protein
VITLFINACSKRGRVVKLAVGLVEIVENVVSILILTFSTAVTFTTPSKAH